MKRRKNLNKIEHLPAQNPVAKYAHQFNSAHIFADKNKFRRHAKHRKQEAFPVSLDRLTGKASCFFALTALRRVSDS
jgi:hypothetical protein